MNTSPNPPLRISARHLGPIFKLDAELSKFSQNIVYARNGIGKSFLSRALRCLELYPIYGDETPGSEIVSEESPGQTGHLELCIGDTVLGALDLNREYEIVSAELDGNIFHVFSNEFVQEELAEKDFQPDGQFDHQIVIGAENIEMDDLQVLLEEKKVRIEDCRKRLSESLNSEINTKIAQRAKIRSNLSERRQLTLEQLIAKFPEMPGQPSQNFNHYLSKLDKIKHIPLPHELEERVMVPFLSIDTINLPATQDCLLRKTQKSEISDSIRQNIDFCTEFFKFGLDFLRQKQEGICPFCRQSINNKETMEVIDAYVQYFKDDEGWHKSELAQLEDSVKAILDKIASLERTALEQSMQFENNKGSISSFNDRSMKNLHNESSAVRIILNDVINNIKIKYDALDSPINMDVSESLNASISELNALIEENNNLLVSLFSSLEQADNERLRVQRKACGVFFCEFARDHWSQIDEIHTLEDNVASIQSKIEDIQKEGSLEFAKGRVADVFRELLRIFFGAEYTFDDTNFIIQRQQKVMRRGAHRTISDGEKTAIAFCYFLACIHKKVKLETDYKKVFLVFDDPVTSLSHDYIYAISHVLKYMKIDDNGTLTFTTSKDCKGSRPRLLVLTHSSYFFNLALSNNVLKRESGFVLYNEGEEHKLESMKSFVAPFQEHLRDVFRVARKNMVPKHTIGLSIRSVIETVGRFCWPNPDDSFASFIDHFSSDAEGLEFHSLLILSMCHGSMYHETPTRDDIVSACEETLQIVEKYAKGQLILLKSEAI